MKTVDFPHLFLTEKPKTREYTNPTGGGKEFELPARPDRRKHADFVKAALDKVWAEALEEGEERKAVSLPVRNGTYLEFESAPGFELKFASLERRTSGIRLLNVKEETKPNGKAVQKATIFVPAGKEHILIDKIARYRDEDTPKGKPKEKTLVESIDNLQLAVLQSFWNDPVDLLPKNSVPAWCEVWLRTSSVEDEIRVKSEFEAICTQLEITVRHSHISFPERIVMLLEATHDQLSELLASCSTIAEFRRAKETADFWTGIPNADQAEWAEKLAGRISVADGTTVTACVLDTGANNGHPLLSPILQDDDCDSVDSDWGAADDDGHGTNMCGTVAYGENLGHWLQSDGSIELPFKLESVKLIPKSGYKESRDLNGYRTSQAVSRAEIMNSTATRAICMAVTALDARDRGRPSSWSGMVDSLSSGAEDGTRRLIVLSAGNVTDPSDWKNYPDSNLTCEIHDPGQAWNALTVGAVTFKDRISNEEMAATYRPIASAGELSPYSTTSAIWHSRWPNKPDVVLEGGNIGIDDTRFTTELDDLSVLSLNHKPQEAIFSANYATSAATALATEQAARLFAQYPNAWPETIRGLMVHSAEWTQQLKQQFEVVGLSEKQNTERLLRICGFGVPSYDRALQSARNSLTMVIEREIKPYKERGKNDYKANEMHFYELPWPADALKDLPGETLITIDVTLSYFIEPGPGEIGWRDKYRYRSHGLDFNLKKPSEDLDEFILRLNKAAREDDGDYGGSSVPWAIGEKMGRTRGSLHRDWVEMTAAEAAEANVVGVFPRTGWWKERAYIGKGDAKARYSLIVSVRAPKVDVDIYTPVAVKVAPEISVST
ncbi:S8 family peptidase [Leisingera caerulea]|uniref:S8 family peptidase n=1 Tax=Leisingera caerulea TaxID=506591 RepID=UPI0021A552B5|nr:S8 family peptidase [Leisingera caerulea]UWQ48648.1 S8 family peptidase [Leisingera caerulea]